MTFICEKLHILVVLKSETTENYFLKRNTTFSAFINTVILRWNGLQIHNQKPVYHLHFCIEERKYFLL